VIQLQINFTQSKDRQDATTLLGFKDWVNTRFQAAADQFVWATGKSQVLELGVWKVDHLHHEVACGNLLQVFLGHTDWYSAVGQKSS
jgi:hypothetical protein